MTLLVGPLRDDCATAAMHLGGMPARSLVEDLERLPRRPSAIEMVVGCGHDWAEAIEEIGWEDGDLLGVGSSTAGPLDRVFIGSRASRIVRHSPVPVVVVPRGAAHALAQRAERA
ncbi:hypothetical protein GCM10009609_16010 [Pseudonocardia aurantiaca]|uniref:Universal stress protein n=1 Tax=Pseudonocardia aurantiaca TaxID=75290 RepID=A0ABW4FM19_9PSEU